MREVVPFLEELRQAAGSTPRRKLNGNTQGLPNVAVEFYGVRNAPAVDSYFMHDDSSTVIVHENGSNAEGEL